jgi:hypothetical protein
MRCLGSLEVGKGWQEAQGKRLTDSGSYTARLTVCGQAWTINYSLDGMVGLCISAGAA